MAGRSLQRKSDGDNSGLLANVRDFWGDNPWADYAITSVVMVVYILVTAFAKHGDWLRWIGVDQQLAVYGTGATVISILGGFSAVAVSVYLASSGDRARAVRARFGDVLRRNWRAIIVGLGLSAVGCLVALIIDSAKDPFSSRFVFIAALVFAIVRFSRMVWLFDALIRVADRDLTDSPPVEPPRLGQAWQKRTGT